MVYTRNVLTITSQLLLSLCSIKLAVAVAALKAPSKFECVNASPVSTTNGTSWITKYPSLPHTC